MIHIYRAVGKRVFDIGFSTALLVTLAPLMILISVLVVLEDGFPVLFRQKRVGKSGDLFEMLKFRSMPVTAPNIESVAARALKRTSIGRFIRRTSIDELPQLFQILKGDMSVVGFRPPLPSQIVLVRLREKNGVLKLSPGLTGLAQIQAYDNIGEDEVVALDIEYANSISFANDIKIIIRTFYYLLKPPPIY